MSDWYPILLRQNGIAQPQTFKPQKCKPYAVIIKCDIASLYSPICKQFAVNISHTSLYLRHLYISPPPATCTRRLKSDQLNFFF